MTAEEKVLMLHAFKAIALARIQLKDMKSYTEYEDEVIEELINDLKIGVFNDGSNTSVDSNS